VFGSDLYVALAIGVIVSLIFAERTGIVPAGLVVPGYLALVLDQPVFVLLILFISLVTYFVVTYGIARVVILYGRRKFSAMLIVGMVVKLVLDYFYPVIPFEIFEFRGIGIIVPGIIANTIQRQGVPVTLISTGFVTLVTFVLLLLYQMVS